MEYVYGYGHGEVLTANLVNGLHNILSGGMLSIRLDQFSITWHRCVDKSQYTLCAYFCSSLTAYAVLRDNLRTVMNNFQGSPRSCKHKYL
jgi:hypothetical protein